MPRALSPLLKVVMAMTLLSVTLTYSPGVSGEGVGDTRRVTRGRYKMGYMFGKRGGSGGEQGKGSGEVPSPASLIITSLFRKGKSVAQLTRDIQRDVGMAQRVARHMDQNGDGYVSVREWL